MVLNSIFLQQFLHVNLLKFCYILRVNQETDLASKIQRNLTYENDTSIPRENIIYFYSAITLGTIIVAIIKSIFFMLFLARASRNLHDYIFSRIIKATMRFYNTNPSGRILNRFSKDLGVIDEYIPSVLIDVIEVSLLVIEELKFNSKKKHTYFTVQYTVCGWTHE